MTSSPGQRQKAERLLLIFAAFLMMISSVITLYKSDAGYLTVYINIIAMSFIAIAVSIKKRR
jgi:hypothetical protein